MIVAGWNLRGLWRCCIANLQAAVDEQVEVTAGQVLRCRHCKTALLVGADGVVSWMAGDTGTALWPESAA